jgi:hypothetical protein
MRGLPFDLLIVAPIYFNLQIFATKAPIDTANAMREDRPGNCFKYKIISSHPPQAC